MPPPWTYDPRREVARSHVSEPRWTGSGNRLEIEVVLAPDAPRPDDPQAAPTPAQVDAVADFAGGVERLRPRIADAVRAWWDARPEPFRGREETMWANGRRMVAYRRKDAAERGAPPPPDAPAPWDFTVTRLEVGRGEPVLRQVHLRRTVGACLPVTVTLDGERVRRVADEKSAWGEVVLPGPFVRVPPPPAPVRAPLPVAAAPLSGTGPWRYDPEQNHLSGLLPLPGWSDDDLPAVPLEIGLGPDAQRAWREEDAVAREARRASPVWQEFERQLAGPGPTTLDAAKVEALLAAGAGGPEIDFAVFVTPAQRAALESFTTHRDSLRDRVRAQVAAEQAAIPPAVRAGLTTRRQRLHAAAAEVQRAREAATGAPPSPLPPFVEADRFFVGRAWMVSGPPELVLEARIEGAMARTIRIRIRGQELTLT